VREVASHVNRARHLAHGHISSDTVSVCSPGSQQLSTWEAPACGCRRGGGGGVRAGEADGGDVVEATPIG
jgi:hypothetical protein